VEGFVRQNERRPATVGPGERPYSSAIVAMRGTTRQNWEVNGIIHGRKVDWEVKLMVVQN